MDQKYKDMVDERLRTNSSEIFGNFSPEHAGYIIAQFIAKAEKSIEILSGNFSDAFYDGISVADLLKVAAERLKKNGGKIRIITVNGGRCQKLLELKEEIDKKSSGVLQYIPAKCTNPEAVNHFMVVDDMRYRLEEPHWGSAPDSIPQYVKAEVCCNGVQKAAQLLASFYRAWDQLGGDEVPQKCVMG